MENSPPGIQTMPAGTTLGAGPGFGTVGPKAALPPAALLIADDEDGAACMGIAGDDAIGASAVFAPALAVLRLRISLDHARAAMSSTTNPAIRNVRIPARDDCLRDVICDAGREARPFLFFALGMMMSGLRCHSTTCPTVSSAASSRADLRHIESLRPL